jgi:hypothetical protein
MVFLSAAQASVCARYPELAVLQLPCWTPQQLVGTALGHSNKGLLAAVASLNGQSYVWATELENVHSLWCDTEPHIMGDGVQPLNSEAFYHSKKPQPWDQAVWDACKEGVMEEALRGKLAADPTLADLLRATGNRPLLSVKSDDVWGFDPAKGCGQNLLGVLWMKLRAELLVVEPGAGATAATPGDETPAFNRKLHPTADGC